MTVLIVDSLLVSGLRFVLARIVDAVEAELMDEGQLREELLAAQMKHELGEIDDGELARVEEVVFAGLRELRRRRGESGEGKLRVESVEATFDPGDATPGAR